MTSFTLTDVETIESDVEAIDPDYALGMHLSLQRAINSGMWSLQGSYGRAMMHAIESGFCLLGPSGCRDFWGNYIPSRDEVQAGTKGSSDFVNNNCGPEWLKAMLAA